MNRDRLQEWLGQMSEGFIVKASEEQIRALSDHAGGKSTSTINILRQHPIHSNKYGEIRDVKPDDFKPFQDPNIGIAFANMTQVHECIPFLPQYWDVFIFIIHLCV